MIKCNNTKKYKTRILYEMNYFRDISQNEDVISTNYGRYCYLYMEKFCTTASYLVVDNYTKNHAR